MLSKFFLRKNDSIMLWIFSHVHNTGANHSSLSGRPTTYVHISSHVFKSFESVYSHKNFFLGMRYQCCPNFWCCHFPYLQLNEELWVCILLSFCILLVTMSIFYSVVIELHFKSSLAGTWFDV